MTTWQRGLLIAILCGGIVTVLWPIGQAVYGWHSQAQLRRGWELASRQAAAEHGTAETAETPVAAVRGASKNHSTSSSPTRARKTRSPATAWEPYRLIIPEMDLDAVVVQGISASALRHGPGYDPNSSLPGVRGGNCVIAGHRNAYGWWFYKLDRLHEGSQVVLRSPYRQFVDRVVEKEVVPDYDTTSLGPSIDSDAPARLTLYSCTLPHGSDRVVISADLESAVAF